MDLWGPEPGDRKPRVPWITLIIALLLLAFAVLANFARSFS